MPNATKRQLNKVPRFDLELERLCVLWARAVEDENTPVNIVAVTKALNRYRHHRASMMAPVAGPMVDIAREGRYHVAWMRTALRQAAKLLGTEGV